MRQSVRISRTRSCDSSRSEVFSSSLHVVHATMDDLEKTPTIKKRKSVKFVEEAKNLVIKVERIQGRYRDDCYYSSEELQEGRRKEVGAIKIALVEFMKKTGAACIDYKTMDIESDTLTWRGIEDFRYKQNKQVGIKMHCLCVLKEQDNQRRSSSSTSSTQLDVEQLRQVSKASSRADRQAADRRGSADAKEQGYKSVSRGFRRSLSNSFKSAMTRGTAGKFPSFTLKRSHSQSQQRTLANAA